MTGVLTLYRTSIGKKAVMAITGFILLGFVFIHMVGNLKIYQGAEIMNAYAAHLRLLGEPIFTYEQALWIARIVLLLAVGLHIMAATQLTLQSQASRPIGYAQSKGVQAVYKYASYTMRWGGVVIALFVIFHLLHFTFGVVGYGGPGAEHAYRHPDPAGAFFAYENVITGFQNPIVSLFYIAAMIALGLHIFHGTWSMFQTLGWNSERLTVVWRGLAGVLAGAIVLGNISIPLAVLTGILSLSH